MADPTPQEHERFAPGLWRCAECDFQLVSKVINVAAGKIGMSLKRAEPCPNDGTAMVRVSWKELAIANSEAANKQAERAYEAEQKLERALAEQREQHDLAMSELADDAYSSGYSKGCDEQRERHAQKVMDAKKGAQEHSHARHVLDALEAAIRQGDAP